MKKLAVTVLVAFATACGSGRQAAWEQDQEAAKAAPPPAAAAEATNDPLADALKSADDAWAKRDVKEELEKAIAAWEKAIAIKADDYKALSGLARAYYLYAETFYRNLETNKEDYLSWTEKGTAAGERAMIAASPEFAAAMKAGGKVEDNCKLVQKNGIEAIYWYGTNLGKWARAAGFTKILANRPKAQACIQQVYDLDKAFFAGAAPRYFGAVYSVLPGAFGGDLDKSKTYYDESLAIAPKYAGTMVLMAENYSVKRQDKALFEKLLNDAMALPDDVLPEMVAETKLEKQKAKELMAKVGDFFD